MDIGTRYTVQLTLALVALICVGTLSPHPLLSQHALGSDKIQHLVGFGSLVVPAALFRPRWLKIMVPAAVALGGLVELIQPYVGRDRDIHDFYADCLGVALALVAASLLRVWILRAGAARP